jgi:hypothetical protein
VPQNIVAMQQKNNRQTEFNAERSLTTAEAIQKMVHAYVLPRKRKNFTRRNEVTKSIEKSSFLRNFALKNSFERLGFEKSIKL